MQVKKTHIDSLKEFKCEYEQDTQHRESYVTGTTKRIQQKTASEAIQSAQNRNKKICSKRHGKRKSQTKGSSNQPLILCSPITSSLPLPAKSGLTPLSWPEGRKTFPILLLATRWPCPTIRRQCCCRRHARLHL